MAPRRESFDLSGPLDLTHVDWNNAHHRIAVMACLVQAVYTLERDCQEKREGPQALAPPWWESFDFQLVGKLVDNVDSSIFGAIYEYKSPPSSGNHSAGGPRFVVAFRGTMLNLRTFYQDIKLDLKLIRRGVQSAPRFETAMQAVRDTVATAGTSTVWLAGHSLGSAIALQAGKNIAKSGSLLESFLFNPPYPSAPIEKIKSEKGKKWLRIAGSTITTALMLTKMSPEEWTQSADSFAALSPWVPRLFVNKADHICSEYIGYFEHRNTMEEMGAVAGSIQRIATRQSLGSLTRRAMRNRAEPSHLIPSANLTINSGPPLNFMEAHGICQWWQGGLRLRSQLYQY